MTKTIAYRSPRSIDHKKMKSPSKTKIQVQTSNAPINIPQKPTPTDRPSATVSFSSPQTDLVPIHPTRSPDVSIEPHCQINQDTHHQMSMSSIPADLLKSRIGKPPKATLQPPPLPSTSENPHNSPQLQPRPLPPGQCPSFRPDQLISPPHTNGHPLQPPPIPTPLSSASSSATPPANSNLNIPPEHDTVLASNARRPQNPVDESTTGRRGTLTKSGRRKSLTKSKGVDTPPANTNQLHPPALPLSDDIAVDSELTRPIKRSTVSKLAKANQDARSMRRKSLTKSKDGETQQPPPASQITDDIAVDSELTRPMKRATVSKLTKVNPDAKSVRRKSLMKSKGVDTPPTNTNQLLPPALPLSDDIAVDSELTRPMKRATESKFTKANPDAKSVRRKSLMKSKGGTPPINTDHQPPPGSALLDDRSVNSDQMSSTKQLTQSGTGPLKKQSLSKSNDPKIPPAEIQKAIESVNVVGLPVNVLSAIFVAMGGNVELFTRRFNR